ncbi:MAG: ribulose-phosphate 3-epimerase [Planctomycetes bacterium]|nr:ribulose-phosphate 3-epimerase [Planctomycetota bacterium]
MSKFKLPKAGTIEMSPSILSADFSDLASEIAQVESAGVNIIHLDIMDGHFVPNITFGPPIVAKLRKHSNAVFDTHLMISDPEKYAKAFADAGSDHITFHIETVDNPEKFIDELHGLGVTCGVTLNPETPVESIEKVAAMCDMVLVMTVHPGFGGQSYIEDAAKKCVRIRELVGPDIRIEVDGGIDRETVANAVGYGADTLVAGNAVFGKPDRAKAINDILMAAQ